MPTRELHEIQSRNRLDQHTDAWKQRYAIRAGIEATLSQNVRTCGLRRTRYRGLQDSVARFGWDIGLLWFRQ